jgi:hypothetical protein
MKQTIRKYKKNYAKYATGVINKEQHFLKDLFLFYLTLVNESAEKPAGQWPTGSSHGSR